MRWAKAAAGAVAVVCLSLAGMILAMRLWQASFNVLGRLSIEPGTTHALLMGTAAKATGENGWYLNIPRLGARCGAELYDFPFANPTTIATFRMLPTIGLRCAAALNLCFLLTFPAVPLAALELGAESRTGAKKGSAV